MRMELLDLAAFKVWLTAVILVTGLGESALGKPLPDHQFFAKDFLPQERPFELSRTPSASSNDYSDAIYAGRFARELDDLEKHQNEIFSDFISAGFGGDEIPTHLPVRLMKLSRTGTASVAAPGPIGFRFPSDEGIVASPPRAVIHSQPVGFAVSPRPALVGPRPQRFRPIHSGGFRAGTPIPVVAGPEAFFTQNHRFGGHL